MPASTTTSFETVPRRLVISFASGVFGLRRLDGEDVGGGRARGDDLRLGVAVHVVQLARHGVQPGLAARLRPAVDESQVQDLLGRHALDLLRSRRAGTAGRPGWRLRIQ
jgi:hypothetical protein